MGRWLWDSTWFFSPFLSILSSHLCLLDPMRCILEFILGDLHFMDLENACWYLSTEYFHCFITFSAYLLLSFLATIDAFTVSRFTTEIFRRLPSWNLKMVWCTFWRFMCWNFRITEVEKVISYIYKYLIDLRVLIIAVDNYNKFRIAEYVC